MVEVSRPELERMYVIGQGVPKPAVGLVYQLWLGSSRNFVPVRQFVPEDGLVLLVFTVDTARFDEILITEEWSGEASAVPSSTGHRWHAFLELARPLGSAILDVESRPEGPEIVLRERSEQG
jgi:hypothetical protein